MQHTTLQGNRRAIHPRSLQPGVPVRGCDAPHAPRRQPFACSLSPRVDRCSTYSLRTTYYRRLPPGRVPIETPYANGSPAPGHTGMGGAGGAGGAGGEPPLPEVRGRKRRVIEDL